MHIWISQDASRARSPLTMPPRKTDPRPPRPPGPWLPGRRGADQMGGTRDRTARVWSRCFGRRWVAVTRAFHPSKSLGTRVGGGIGNLGELARVVARLSCAERKISATIKLPGNARRLALTISSRPIANGSAQLYILWAPATHTAPPPHPINSQPRPQTLSNLSLPFPFFVRLASTPLSFPKTNPIVIPWRGSPPRCGFRYRESPQATDRS